jgi:hypothetical protein
VAGMEVGKVIFMRKTNKHLNVSCRHCKRGKKVTKVCRGR